MSGRSLAEQIKKAGSNGSQAATCVRCSGEIPAYAGRCVSLSPKRYAHHPGQCRDHADQLAAIRAIAGQASFAWQCGKISAGHGSAGVCELAGMGQESAEAYAGHFRREHGATELAPTVKPIRLRRGVPAARLSKPVLGRPCKRLEWATSDWLPTGQFHPAELGGGPVLAEVITSHRGQFWSNAGPHEIWAVEDMRAAGLPNRLVCLSVMADGTLTADWSEASRNRREANRAARAADDRAAREAQRAAS